MEQQQRPVSGGGSVRPGNGPEQLPLPLFALAYGLPPIAFKPGVEPKRAHKSKESNSLPAKDATSFAVHVNQVLTHAEKLGKEILSMSVEPNGSIRIDFATDSERDCHREAEHYQKSDQTEDTIPDPLKEVHFVSKKLKTGWVKYVYAWRGGAQIMTSPGTEKPRLTAAAWDALDLAREQRAAGLHPKKRRTIDQLIEEYQASEKWKRLAAKTRSNRKSALKSVSVNFGSFSVRLFEGKEIRASIGDWRDSRADTPRAADAGIQALQALLNFAIFRGYLEKNFAHGFGTLYKNGQRRDIIWTEADLEAFEKTAGVMGRAAFDALLLCTVTGMRRADLAQVEWGNVGKLEIKFWAEKESEEQSYLVTIPITDKLREILDRLRTRPRQEGVTTLLVDSDGLPWDLDKLTKEVSGIAKKAGIYHHRPARKNRPAQALLKHLHDARGTFVTFLKAEVDLGMKDIAHIMGWSEKSVEGIIRLYVDNEAVSTSIAKRINRGYEERSVNRTYPAVSDQA